jgi:hypothetical protein
MAAERLRDVVGGGYANQTTRNRGVWVARTSSKWDVMGGEAVLSAAHDTDKVSKIQNKGKPLT